MSEMTSVKETLFREGCNILTKTAEEQVDCETVWYGCAKWVRNQSKSD